MRFLFKSATATIKESSGKFYQKANGYVFIYLIFLDYAIDDTEQVVRPGLFDNVV